MDKKKLNKGSIILGVLYLVLILLIIINADGLQKECFEDVNLTSAEYILQNDIIGENIYEITGEDPWILFCVEEGVYKKGIITFADEADSDVNVQIFYAATGEAFSEGNSFWCTRKKNSDYVAFELPDESVGQLRVDYNDNAGKTFEIVSVAVAKNSFGTIVKGIVTAKTLAYVTILTVCMLLLYFLGYKKRNEWITFFETDSNVKIIRNLMFVGSFICIIVAALYWYQILYDYLIWEDESITLQAIINVLNEGLPPRKGMSIYSQYYDATYTYSTYWQYFTEIILRIPLQLWANYIGDNTIQTYTPLVITVIIMGICVFRRNRISNEMKNLITVSNIVLSLNYYIMSSYHYVRYYWFVMASTYICLLICAKLTRNEHSFGESIAAILISAVPYFFIQLE